MFGAYATPGARTTSSQVSPREISTQTVTA
jgi:hypothetical protein